MAMSYRAYSTPLNATRYIAQKLVRTESHVSWGKTDGYFVKPAVVRYIDLASVVHTCALLRGPLPLTEGKKGWYVYQAGAEHSTSLR